jgi:P27 family predicted phage terminase small subunit
MSTKAARTPKNLDPEGSALWRAIALQVAGDGLQLDQRELKLLESACREQDMLARIEAVLSTAPLVVLGAQNQMVAHPLIGEARRSRAQIASLLKAIGLDDPDAGSGSGRGSRTTSTSARGAAFSRHYGNVGGTG